MSPGLPRRALQPLPVTAGKQTVRGLPDADTEWGRGPRRSLEGEGLVPSAENSVCRPRSVSGAETSGRGEAEAGSGEPVGGLQGLGAGQWHAVGTWGPLSI